MKVEKRISNLCSVPISELSNEPIIDSKDFIQFIDIISINYRNNAHNKESPDYQLSELIFRMAQEENFSKSEFKAATLRMIKKQKFANWTTADFFEYDRPKIYNQNEVLKLSGGTYSGFKRVLCDGINTKIWINELSEIRPPFKEYPKAKINTSNGNISEEPKNSNSKVTNIANYGVLNSIAKSFDSDITKSMQNILNNA